MNKCWNMGWWFNSCSISILDILLDYDSLSNHNHDDIMIICVSVHFLSTAHALAYATPPHVSSGRVGEGHGPLIDSWGKREEREEKNEGTNPMKKSKMKGGERDRLRYSDVLKFWIVVCCMKSWDHSPSQIYSTTPHHSERVKKRREDKTRAEGLTLL
jgi:hypothetical protein